MKREVVCCFIRNIYLPFCQNLYYYATEKKDCYEDSIFCFPDCCKLASNIMSTFLNITTDGDFQCLYSKSAKYPHSWCQSNNLNIVIDITGFQFDDDVTKGKKIYRFHASKYTEDELQVELANREYIYTLEEYRKKRFEYFIESPIKISDTPIGDNAEYFLTPESFEKFLSGNLDVFLKNPENTSY